MREVKFVEYHSLEIYACIIHGQRKNNSYQIIFFLKEIGRTVLFVKNISHKYQPVFCYILKANTYNTIYQFSNICR